MNTIRKFIAYNIAANFKFTGTRRKNRYATKELVVFMLDLLRLKQNFTRKNRQNVADFMSCHGTALMSCR